MATTKYQVLYRYMNEATNTPITNDMANSYEETLEFYTDDHKIYSKDPATRMEAENDKEEIISYGNNGTNPKFNMLFAYDGTKKIKHKKWVPEETGYIVRDYTLIDRNLIGNQGDFTKPFTTINAATPEDGGTVICKKSVMNTYFTPLSLTNNAQADMAAGTEYAWYSAKRIDEIVENSTFFKLTGYETKASGMATLKDSYWSSYYVFIGPIFMAMPSKIVGKYSGTAIALSTPANCYSSVYTVTDNIETTIIPGHYEETTDYPYLTKDCYKRISFSPWFVNTTCASLEAALTRAKVLVDMIGLENVKIIKIVPFDQFVKIK